MTLKFTRLTPVALLILFAKFNGISATNETEKAPVLLPSPQLIFPSQIPDLSSSPCGSLSPCQNGATCYVNASDSVVGCICQNGWKVKSDK